MAKTQVTRNRSGSDTPFITSETEKLMLSVVDNLSESLRSIHDVCSDLIDSKDARILDSAEALGEAQTGIDLLKKTLGVS